MGQGKRIGYIRVSTADQNPERQLEGIELDKKFIDYASAKSTDRPQLQVMLDFIREDDIIIVHSMDRLARNVIDLRKIVNFIVQKGAEIQFKKEGFSFNNGSTNPIATLLLSLMGAVAEFELDYIRERCREGIAAAKAKGKYRGGKKKLNEEKIKILKELMMTRESKSKIAERLAITRPTLYNYLREHNIQ